MYASNKVQLVPLTQEKHLSTLVENRKAYTLQSCEMNVFETHQASWAVPLSFSDFVVTSMLRGKKVMHLGGRSGFDYLPGETVIVPPRESMLIDFPEAGSQNPTQCIALAIDSTRIRQTVDMLNDRYPREGRNDYWNLSHNDYHFRNDEGLAAHITKLIQICSGHNKDKEVLADLALQELIIRIIQTQHLQVADTLPEGGAALQQVVHFIRTNIAERITMDQLSRIACMSKTHFHRVFRREFGISPLAFILHERIREAKKLLSVKDLPVSDISFQLGFMDQNYFQRQFKKSEGITPRQFRQQSQPAG